MDRGSQLDEDDEDDEDDKDDEEDEEEAGGRRRQEEEATDIKSNNPHLAGGEKQLPAASKGSITLDKKWYGNCKKRGFAHRVKAHNNLCLVYTKFNALSYGDKLSFFGEAIALHGLVHFLNTTGSSLTKSFRVVYAYFNRISLRISYVKNTMT